MQWVLLGMAVDGINWWLWPMYTPSWYPPKNSGPRGNGGGKTIERVYLGEYVRYGGSD